MQDQAFIDPAKERIPQDWRRKYLKRPLEKLPEDVTKAYDQIWKLRREKDEINARLLRTQRRLGWANMKIWLLTFVVSAEGAVIGWLVKEFLDRFK